MTREPELGFKFIEGELDGFRTVTPVPDFAPKSGFEWAGQILDDFIRQAGLYDPQPLPGDALPRNVVDITNRLRSKQEPLDPAYNPLWAQDVPGLDINSSIKRSCQPGPYSVWNMPAEPLGVDDLNDFISKWRDTFANGSSVYVTPEFVWESEPYRVIDRPDVFARNLHTVLPEDEDGFLVPPTMMENLAAEMRKLGDARLISHIYDVPLCLLGEECDHKSHKALKPYPAWRRKWEEFKGKARWARERFARRVYEFISEYPFEEEEVDW